MVQCDRLIKMSQISAGEDKAVSAKSGVRLTLSQQPQKLVSAQLQLIVAFLSNER